MEDKSIPSAFLAPENPDRLFHFTQWTRSSIRIELERNKKLKDGNSLRASNFRSPSFWLRQLPRKHERKDKLINIKVER